MRRIAIVGGGIAGVTAAYELARMAKKASYPTHVSLLEASQRLGGTVETIHEGGFVIEGGPDGWVSDKPWARELAIELGLKDELIPSKDEGRKTWVLVEDTLKAMPDGMRMMVPSDLAALDDSDLFSYEARQAFHDEVARAEDLKKLVPEQDESVADFVQRHFGEEVLMKIGAPLLSGVFGGDVAKLSVRAVMAPFVAMERESGSLVAALQFRERTRVKSSLFTTLRSGLGTLIDRMIAEIPPSWVRLGTEVIALERDDKGWWISAITSQGHVGREHYDALLMAAPAHVAAQLLERVDGQASELMQMDASSAVVVGFGFDDAAQVPVPQGFGLLIPPGSKTKTLLMACTFMDQKYGDRVPAGGRLMRAFFGGSAAERLMRCGNDEIAVVARMELAHILGPLPEPRVTVVRRWPLSLPQYAVGHLDRMAKLDSRAKQLGNLWLLGNGYRGVGLPDLIRDARAAAQAQITPSLN